LNRWNSSSWKVVLGPGGVLLGMAVLLFSGLFKVSPATLSFYYSTVFLAGLLLAWRFHSGRTFAGLIVILLAQRAVEFFAAGHGTLSGPGRTALDATAFLLAANFVCLALAGEFSFSVAALAPRLGVLFLESVFVAVLCRPQPAWGSSLFRGTWLPIHWFTWTRLSQFPWLALLTAFVVLLLRSASSRKQLDAGMAWAIVAASCGLSAGGVGRVADGYIATAGLVLLVSVIETSYRMAYHDELTGIPSRRALNDATLALEQPYSVAVADVDHFKQFNDTYGHDIGDEVLRMVASRLGKVGGGGRAFRYGGEEFTILFPGKTTQEASPFLEEVRKVIENSSFRLRGRDRRVTARGPERRVARHSVADTGKPQASSRSIDLHVTVSIGAAQSKEELAFETVLEHADKALYRAKANGRNRLEVDGRPSPGSPGSPRKRRSKSKSA